MTIKIGDVLPIPKGMVIDRAAIGYVKAQRTRGATILARASENGAARNELEARARKIAEGNREIAQRLADPYERAKAFLQRKGYVVFSGDVLDPPQKGVLVGRQRMSDKKAVMAYAMTLGWVDRVKSKAR